MMTANTANIVLVSRNAETWAMGARSRVQDTGSWLMPALFGVISKPDL